MFFANAHTHLLGGLVAGAAVSSLFPGDGALLLVLAATLAGPLPDVDHPGSLYGRLVPLPGVVRTSFGHEPYLWGGLNEGRLQRGLAGRRTPFGVLWHRGPTHSLVAAFAAGLAPGAACWAAFGPPSGEAVGLGVFVGYLSHLGLDALNVSGQALFWPFSQTRWRPKWPRWPVGSAFELLVGAALAGGLLLLAPRILPWRI